MSSSSAKLPDIVIVGAGIIGLSLALELHARGALVTVLERDTALSHASTAAAGMLATEDPHNPPALLPLAHYSLSLYPDFLARMERISGVAVPVQTDTTWQRNIDGSMVRLAENSIDPRQLAAALLAAVHNTTIQLHEHRSAPSKEDTTQRIATRWLIHATGAWTNIHGAKQLPITPRKGQMMRVQLPQALTKLREVHRTEHVYIVPRTHGPQAGTALIGATVEDAGFDTTPHSADLAQLRKLAAGLLPALADPVSAPKIEAWAGLRPATPDSLPILGPIGNGRQILATGHYRNGILLAPATAMVIADLCEDKQPAVNLQLFSADRFE